MKLVQGWFAVMVLGLLAAEAGAADAIVWKLASGYSDSSFHTINLREFARDVESLSKGALRVVVHGNNSLVKLADIRAAVESGSVEAGEVILTGISKEVPMAGADSVPFVVGDFGDAERGEEDPQAPQPALAGDEVPGIHLRVSRGEQEQHGGGGEVGGFAGDEYAHGQAPWRAWKGTAKS